VNKVSVKEMRAELEAANEDIQKMIAEFEENKAKAETTAKTDEKQNKNESKAEAAQ
jgi:hypothetical protein